MSEITFYTAPTSNGYKVSIALEELSLDYEPIHVHFDKQHQKTDEFRSLNPNCRIPVIVDHENEDFVLAESGAILLYLAEREKKLMPTRRKELHKAMQWLMFQMSAIGPMMGQAMFFQRIAAPKGIVQDYATNRYIKESRRLLEVLDKELRNREFICNNYSMVDIATFPWVRAHQWANVQISDLPNLSRWLEQIQNRDAVKRGLSIPIERKWDYSEEELNVAMNKNAQLYDA